MRDPSPSVRESIRAPHRIRSGRRLVLDAVGPLYLGLAVWLLASAAPSRAADGGDIRAAVAANFTPCLTEIAALYTQETGRRVLISTASTGVLYAQITAGAPFDVFFAADAERPRRLGEAGLTVDGSCFTYAVGRLVLWVPDRAGQLCPQTSAADLTATLDTCLATDTRPLALANPRHAPYGLAARQALEALGLWTDLAGDVAMGLNVGQTWQYVATGNAALGFVALSQVLGARHRDDEWRPGLALVVPDGLHAPITQQAVLLRSAADNTAARGLLKFLRTPVAREILVRYGYESPQTAAP